MKIKELIKLHPHLENSDFTKGAFANLMQIKIMI